MKKMTQAEDAAKSIITSPEDNEVRIGVFVCR